MRIAMDVNVTIWLCFLLLGCLLKNTHGSSNTGSESHGATGSRTGWVGSSSTAASIPQPALSPSQSPGTTIDPINYSLPKDGIDILDNRIMDSNISMVPAWKRDLPDPLNIRTTLHRILIPTSPNSHVQVYLLGTSHVSTDSSADVDLLLQHLQPNVVFLELCAQRIGMLEQPPPKPPPIPIADANDTNHPKKKKMSFWKRVEQLQQNSEGSLSRASAMGTLLLTEVQDGYADSLGVELGGEFRVAHTWCTTKSKQQEQQQRPYALVLGDRPLQLTLLRAWESLSLWGKLKVLGGLVYSTLKPENPEDIRKWMQSILEGDSDVLTESIADLAKHFPSLERVIIKERDAFMAAKLYQTCRAMNTQNQTLVAIVGAGHCPGICDWLTNGNGDSPEQILSRVVETKKYPLNELESVIGDVTQLPLD